MIPHTHAVCTPVKIFYILEMDCFGQKKRTVLSPKKHKPIGAPRTSFLGAPQLCSINLSNGLYLLINYFSCPTKSKSQPICHLL